MQTDLAARDGRFVKNIDSRSIHHNSWPDPPPQMHAFSNLSTPFVSFHSPTIKPERVQLYRLLPILGDIKRPLEQQEVMPVVIYKSRHRFVVAAGQHAGGGFVGFEFLLVDGFGFGVWCEGTLCGSFSKNRKGRLMEI